MIARLFGKSNTYTFRIEIFSDIKTFDFLSIEHHEDGHVLTQIVNITRDGDKLFGDGKIIGFRDSGVLKNIRTPFQNDAKIEMADDSFIEKVVGLNNNSDAFLGVLEHHPNLHINLDLKKTITKHIAILAKSGAGKSYTVGVLLEEVIKKNIPIIILDPHNEYASIKYPNSDKKDLKRLEKFNLQPHGFLNQIKEYSPDTTINPQCEPVTLDINKLKPHDLVDALPQKLSPGQQNILFNILSTVNNRVNFDELIFAISNEESNAKWSLITLLESLKKLKLFSSTPTQLHTLVKYKQASIISLKGVDPYVQEVFVSSLLRDMFEARKKEEIPPFLLVLEEAHNFCPERSLGETKSSKIIRTLAAEGRKFGIGLCVISQRPAKIDKNVVSQCTTQILLKITNPNDLRSVISSSEGVDTSSENEIQKLNIGTCLLTGVIDIPLKVNVRPRISKHGGETVDITLPYEVENGAEPNPSVSYGGNVEETQEEVRQQREQSRAPQKEKAGYKGAHTEFIQYIAPEIEAEDAKVMLGAHTLSVQLIPAALVKLKVGQGEIQLLLDKHHKKIIKTLFPYEGADLKDSITSLSQTERKILGNVLTLSDRFNPAELLIKTDVTFNEILRVCDALAAKGLITKHERDFEIGNMAFAKNISALNFYGAQKFEEVSYDSKLAPKMSDDDVKANMQLFGVVENVKDIFLVRYVGK
ncbi:MAG: ATP-binding protein [Candidatus Woesearchaeota archaeon]|nr:MAG: ATP-binding protein [Candidatus Woesearchaeota archaeon]